MRELIPLLVVLSIGGWSRASGADTSVCDIMHPNAAFNKEIIVDARVLFTMHGVFLTTDGCSDHSYDIVMLYPGIEGTPPVPFDLDPQSLERLKPFFRTNGGTAVACGALKGKVFYKANFRSKPFG